MEAPPGFEPGVEVLQTSALPLGDGADRTLRRELAGLLSGETLGLPTAARSMLTRAKVGAGNGIRTRDFDLGKVALYH